MWARPDLRAELKGLGLLRSPDLDQAFLHVRQESFLPESLSLLAYADMPLPVHVSANPPTMPSPRCLVAAIDLLEPEAGLRVLIAGCRGGYPAALLAEIVGPEHVVVVETDSERRTRSAGRLEAAGFGAVRVLPSIPDRSEAHTSELQSHVNLVCRLLLEKKKKVATNSARRSQTSGRRRK